MLIFFSYKISRVSDLQVFMDLEGYAYGKNMGKMTAHGVKYQQAAEKLSTEKVAYWIL